ncbi:MAG: ThiF family adenylyltransferase [Bdellovibrio sp.]
MFKISKEAINRDECIEFLSNETAGGLVIFEGWVRNHNQGHPVSSLEYQVYHALAQKEGEKILSEARTRFGITDIACVHREGHLQIGDVAVFIGANAVHRDAAFLASRYVIDEIKKRLPIWKREHYKNRHQEWVFCKDHATHVHFSENEYYARQENILKPDVLRHKTVTVIGAGGLGCPVLLSLAAAGVGKIRVVDFDKVEISNIHRQPLYSVANVGDSKAILAQKKLLELNPFIKVEAINQFLDVTNVQKIIQHSDLVLDCTDNLKTKYLIHDACFYLGLPLISASIFKFDGQIRTFLPKSGCGCLRCLPIAQPEDSLIGNCNEFGVLASSLSVLGGWQASEALLFLDKGTNSTVLTTAYVNIQNLSTIKIKNPVQENCPCCLGIKEPQRETLELSWGEAKLKDFEVLDIRQMSDSEVLSQVATSGTRAVAIALACNKGVRSLRLAKELSAQGLSQVFSVIGGAASRPQGMKASAHQDCNSCK